MADTVITLGNFQFRDLEIPVSINFGGEQKLNIHELVGGSRVIDVLGGQNDDISWGGLMTGSDALSRALQLDSMRIAGDILQLSWFNLNYSVLIKHFKANTERFYQVNYEITLTVVQDASQSDFLSIFGINEAVLGDLLVANTLSAAINSSTLSPLMSSLTTAMNAVTTFQGASQSTINSVLTPLTAVKNNVASSLSAVSARLFGA
jgi:hypothetical protein